MKYIDVIASVATVIILALIVTIFFAYGLTKQDKVDCLKWSNEAKSGMLAGYYITANQKSQCDFLKIQIDAPVK